MPDWVTDMWRAWRAALRRPGSLLLSICVLALGVSASVGVFTLIDQAILRPLPFRIPSKIVSEGFTGGNATVTATLREYRALKSMNGVSSTGIMRRSAAPSSMTINGKPFQVSTTFIDHKFLTTLGIYPGFGRDFSAEEDQPNGPKVALITHEMWRDKFGSDRNVVGRTFKLNGKVHTIIGVLPKSFEAINNGGDVVLPLAAPVTGGDRGRNYIVVARLKDGVSISALDAQVKTKLANLHASDSKYSRGSYKYGVRKLSQALRGDTESILALFQIFGLFVLAAAIINLTNLLLAKAVERKHDAAVRNALGASVFRIIIPTLAESVLIGVLGSALGILIVAVCLSFLKEALPAEWLPGRVFAVSPLTCVLSFTVGVASCLCAALLGMGLIHSVEPVAELREGGRATMGKGSARLGSVLVVAQVAIAVSLLCAAGVFLHSLYDALGAPLGFSDHNILTFEMTPIESDYPDVQSMHQEIEQVQRRLRQIPGVVAVAISTNLPAGGANDELNMPMRLPGQEVFSNEYHAVSPHFFDAFGIRLLRGRDFTSRDMHGGAPVAIVSQDMASDRFGGHAIGRTIRIGGMGLPEVSATVIGVVANTRQRGPLGDFKPIIYVPLSQVPDSLFAQYRTFAPFRVALKVKGIPMRYYNSVVGAMAEIAPDQPISKVCSMSQVVSSTLSDLQTDMSLIGVFAGVSLILAAAGMYAVMTISVSRREHEFGVRMALGATPMSLIQLVLHRALYQIGIGIIVGSGIWFFVSQFLHRTLDQAHATNNYDPAVLIGAFLIVGIIGLVSCLSPAIRAGGIAPARTLQGR